MEQIKKWNKRLEKIWLVIAIIASIGAIGYSIIDKGDLEADMPYYLLALIAWGIYWLGKNNFKCNVKKYYRIGFGQRKRIRETLIRLLNPKN